MSHWEEQPPPVCHGLAEGFFRGTSGVLASLLLCRVIGQCQILDLWWGRSCQCALG